MSIAPLERETPLWRVTYGHGPALQEILAVLSGSEVQAEALLKRFGNAQGLARATPEELGALTGVGRVTVARLKAALALANRLLEPVDPQPVITTPAEAAAICFPRIMGSHQEELLILRLNTRNRLIGAPIELYRGSVNTTVLRPGEIFRDAIRANAASILVAHTHPSGICDPSPEDIAVTRALQEAGQLLDITLVDHLILGHPPRFVSLKEQGVLEP